MTESIVIIGSGFAAYQLVKALRRGDASCPIHVFTANDGCDYNKPDLSHVFSRQQQASDMIRQTGEAFAQEQGVTMHAHCQVEAIDPVVKTITVSGEAYAYGQLVLATGARAFIPPMQGEAVQQVLTLNSLEEYQQGQEQLATAAHVTVIGGGLIGTELAMDLAISGKQVTLVDPASQLMASLLPEAVAHPLEKTMRKMGIAMFLGDHITRLDKQDSDQAELSAHSTVVTLASGRTFTTSQVIAAAGLVPNVSLAQQAGLQTTHGIVVDSQLRTSQADIYALGDCAEINGRVLAYLQPALLSANALAKTLLGTPTDLVLPPMLVKVKTPQYPIQLSGQNVQDAKRWQLDVDHTGTTCQSFNAEGKAQGFVVTQEHQSKAFTLLNALR
ncbi:nitric oxide reductase FlRd-NAD(+) reductase [Photobacterium aphoticum]|uniref:Nitric oxide reductase FlRd-NAD(+) reductase n=1 Tax=Photobacterium aphoticum TaxID=754436 RepID=A0A090QI57_9GAMM|nr:nitric oxide reductase FlRd-NAD(+) reductase [Photobacterium aphoticum]